jgi:hypothetical protein
MVGEKCDRFNMPDDPELAATAIRYVPMPECTRLTRMLGTLDWRLVASGEMHQHRDFTHARVRHVNAPGQIDIDLDSLLGKVCVGLRLRRTRVCNPKQADDTAVSCLL